MIGIGKINNNKRNWLFAFIFAFLLATVFFTLNFIIPNGEMLLKSARANFDRGHYQRALIKFKRAMDISLLSSGIKCEAQIFYATCFLRENMFKEASVEFKKFIAEYPDSFWTPQAYFDLAYSEYNLGNHREAIRIYKKIINDFATTTWAKYSGERLKEFRAEKPL